MADALVLDMPMEFCLELVPVIGPHLADPEGKLVDDMVDEVDGVGLGMPRIDLQRPDACRIINRGILKTPDFLSFFSDEGQELHIDLDLVAIEIPDDPHRPQMVASA